MDRIWRKSSYSLHLQIGLGFVFSQPIDHGGWPAAKGCVWALVIVEKTVKYYMTQIMQKFNVSNRLSVVIAAQKAEWCTNNGKAV